MPKKNIIKETESALKSVSVRVSIQTEDYEVLQQISREIPAMSLAKLAGFAIKKGVPEVQRIFASEMAVAS